MADQDRTDKIKIVKLVRSILSPEERLKLNAELFFMHGGRYQSQLLSLGLEDPTRVEQFVSGVALSRYVGIIRFQLDDAVLVDIVCDTTDISRDYPRRAPLLAVLPFIGEHIPTFSQMVSKMAPWALVI